MPRRLSFQLSLWSLFLLVTCTASGVALWLTSQRLRTAQSKIVEQRLQIRELSHKLGILTEEDLPFVQILRSNPHENRMLPPLRSKEYREFAEVWRIHLPGHKKWRMYWADSQIPASGLPAKEAGFRDLPIPRTDWEWLGISFLHHGAAGCSTEFYFGSGHESKWSYWIPSENQTWLEKDAECDAWFAGPWDHHTGECFFEQFACDKPVIIYRERRLLELSDSPGFVPDPKPCQGFMVWLEATGDSNLAASAPDKSGAVDQKSTQ